MGTMYAIMVLSILELLTIAELEKITYETYDYDKMIICFQIVLAFLLSNVI